MTYSHASSNTIHKVSVEFAYRYWRNIATEPQKASLDSTLQDILRNSILKQVQTRLPPVITKLAGRLGAF